MCFVCVSKATYLLETNKISQWLFQYSVYSKNVVNSFLRRNTTTIAVLWPLYRSTYISWYLQLRTGGFCWCKVLLPTYADTQPFNGPLSRTTRVSRYQNGISVIQLWNFVWSMHILIYVVTYFLLCSFLLVVKCTSVCSSSFTANSVLIDF